MLTQHISDTKLNKSGKQASYVGGPVRHVYKMNAAARPAFCANLPGSAVLTDRESEILNLANLNFYVVPRGFAESH